MVLFSNISFGEDPALGLRARGQDKRDGGRGGRCGCVGREINCIRRPRLLGFLGPLWSPRVSRFGFESELSLLLLHNTETSGEGSKGR